MDQLCCGAFFFGMRSYESLKVTEKRKTKRLKIRNVRLFRNNREINDKESDLIQFADTVSITFRFQKRQMKDGGSQSTAIRESNVSRNNMGKNIQTYTII